MRKSSRVCAKKTSYKNEENSDEGEDFVDSGSEASIHDEEESDEGSADSSGNEFKEATPKQKKKVNTTKKRKSPSLSKKMLKRAIEISNNIPETETPFSVKDLTEQEKLLPEFLNLSESGSDSEDEDHNKSSDYKMSIEHTVKSIPEPPEYSDNISQPTEELTYKIGRLSDSDSENEEKESCNISTSQTNRLQFEKLHEYSKKLEEAKKCFETYNKSRSEKESVEKKSVDVKSLLAMGETSTSKKKKIVKQKEVHVSDSDDEDFEEVQGEAKHKVNIPKGGIQVVIDVPTTRKDKKKMDLEMMLKRRINRVKKEHQVYMHKVHLLCWIGHGNYLHKIISNPNLMGASLSLLPSEKSYPNGRVSIKYMEEMSKWYSDFIELKEDKNESKFKFNKPPLKNTLLQQICKKSFTSKKNKVLVFVSLLRALGIKCRLVASFCVVPLRPPATELCSLSVKKADDKNNPKNENCNRKNKSGTSRSSKSSESQSQTAVDIIQLDGADDLPTKKPQTRSKRLSLAKENPTEKTNKKMKDVTNSSDSKMSYWDKITQDTIQKKEKRLSHRDLVTSTSSPSKTISNGKTNSKATPNKKSKEVNNSNSAQTSKMADKSDSKSKVKPAEKPPKRKNGDTGSKSTKNNKNTPSTSKSEKPPSRSSTTAENKTSSYFKKSDDQSPQSSHAPKKPKLEQKAKKSDATKKTTTKTAKSATSEYFKNENQTLDRLKSANKKRLDSNSSDADFEPPKKKIQINRGKIDRRVLSSDDESSDKAKKGVDFWCEVYSEEEEQWISVDVIKGQVYCAEKIYSRASHPVLYIVTWDMNGYVKDVTRRYVPHWNTTTRKLRVDPKWYEVALRPWMAPAHLRDRREDEELDKLQLEAPIPKTVGEFKNHPLYALKRHLLKFEVIYPPDALILGFIRDEPVYARECVHICRSRETWVKEAKVVKPNEKPYKIVKARPKYDKLSGQVLTDKPLEIFGPWQVEDYVPPKAENGIVPRNPYGNVELFKPCMLPEGTVHITLPGLNKVAKKLGIDCAPAMIGFDYHSGGSHPMYDGFVICKEFEDVILVAWEQEREEAENRAREKIEKRVYGNWRRIIRGLIIREKLQAKYDFRFLKETDDQENKPSTSKSKK